MQFTRLRLAGFKSFVEPTDLLIETGLTGVVGPNGCGKSNLVEALRWVMGETSARQMRGGEMDDVIFGGTTSRPARNHAEVQLLIDNSDRRAPTAFNDASELEVSRRIDRGQGSQYRVNGRESRARDVQMLFADAATGANSPSLVSQGRVAAMINARPFERRAILEDAAGIGGLQARRKEAEQRLTGAETNLARIDDILSTLTRQREGLEGQAAQAAKYRQLSEAIRAAETVLLAIRWLDAKLGRTKAAEALRQAELKVAESLERVAELTTLDIDLRERLPELRHEDAEAAASLHRLHAAQGALDGEAQRLVDQTRAVQERLALLARDREREESLAGDAETALARLTEEEESLAENAAVDAERLTETLELLAEQEADLERAEAAVQAATETLAKTDARRATLERHLNELSARRARLSAEQDKLRGDLAAIDADLTGLPDAEELESQLETVMAAEDEARLAVAKADEAQRKAQDAEAEAGRMVQSVAARRSRLTAERAGIAAALAADLPPGVKDPVIDALTVEPGYEAALGVALGEDLQAPVRLADNPRGAQIFWQQTEGKRLSRPDSLPDGARPLSAYVGGPEALARRLMAVGVVADLDTALALWPQLGIGQRLVTPAGDLVRWDGYRAAAGTPSRAALRLERRNHLTRLDDDIAGLEEEEMFAEERQARTADALARAREAETGARARLKAASDHATAMQESYRRQSALLSAAEAKRAALTDTLDRLTAEAQSLEDDQRASEAERAGLSASEPLLAALAEARAEATSQRAQAQALRSEGDRLKRDAHTRAARQGQVARERADWARRSGNSAAVLADLDARQAQAEAEAAMLAQAPDDLADRRDALLAEIENAEAKRRAVADRLAEAERSASDATRRLKEAEGASATAREARVRAEAAQEAAIRDAQAVAERIRERLDCRPDEVVAQAALDPDLSPQAVASAAQSAASRLEKLSAEREALGPVNLRADQELAEITAQIETLSAEKEDLTQAIERLRGAIASINREGRERLLASFHKVNGFFEELFVRLFGGGRAHLQLTESDDPLAAGLEIMASPPGKKLQTLSLLSGGEQALTALSLIFAVFLTNPSPICVLDEVDAPLDDANVDRFCGLLDHIASASGTRFLCVTHHRLTMARMDRLYGVTMAERGISQLVSVDLSRAEKLRFPPRDPGTPELPGLRG
jgi:chromosome segregation protein